MYVCTYAYVCLRMLVSIHVGIASTFFLWMCYREQVNLIGHWSNTRCPVLCWNPPSGTCPKVSIYIPYLRSSRTTATAIITITITNVTTKEIQISPCFISSCPIQFHHAWLRLFRRMHISSISLMEYSMAQIFTKCPLRLESHCQIKGGISLRTAKGWFPIRFWRLTSLHYQPPQTFIVLIWKTRPFCINCPCLKSQLYYVISFQIQPSSVA